jgi:nicotinamide mononucleotide (NMN) deamidase PncC
MITPALLDGTAALLDACRTKQVKLATVESCTGGVAQRGRATVAGYQVFPGDRTAIRVAAVETAFALIRARL